MEIGPQIFLWLIFGVSLLILLSLSLGFLLGYSASRLYNTSAKNALNNLGELNNHLRSQLNAQFTPHITEESDKIPRRRTDEIEADLDDQTQLNKIDRLLGEMEPEERSQFYARFEDTES